MPLPIVRGHQGSGMLQQLGVAPEDGSTATRDASGPIHEQFRPVMPGGAASNHRRARHTRYLRHSGSASPEGTEASFDMNGVMATGKRIIGIINGDGKPDLFISALVKPYTQGRFPFDKLVKFYRRSRTIRRLKIAKKALPSSRLSGGYPKWSPERGPAPAGITVERSPFKYLM